jgi:hypothetical protein
MSRTVIGSLAKDTVPVLGFTGPSIFMVVDLPLAQKLALTFDEEPRSSA